MSWAFCYNGSNNIHFDYPALMSDGKLSTNWHTACANNNRLKRQNGIVNNYDYRQFLQKNADASNLEVKNLLKLLMSEWEEKQEQKMVLD